jgi:hypothetical protein
MLQRIGLGVPRNERLSQSEGGHALTMALIDPRAF